MNTTLNSVAGFLQLVWQQPEVKFLLAFIMLNVVVAIAATLKTGEFQLQKMGEFLVRKVVPYVLVYGALKAAVGLLTPDEQAETGISQLLLTSVRSAIVLSLTGDMLPNLFNLLGLPLPKPLAKILSESTVPTKAGDLQTSASGGG
jgi:phage-related holin